jgi:hypothetical protein
VRTWSKRTVQVDSPSVTVFYGSPSYFLCRILVWAEEPPRTGHMPVVWNLLIHAVHHGLDNEAPIASAWLGRLLDPRTLARRPYSRTTDLSGEGAPADTTFRSEGKCPWRGSYGRQTEPGEAGYDG